MDVVEGWAIGDGCWKDKLGEPLCCCRERVEAVNVCCRCTCRCMLPLQAAPAVALALHLSATAAAAAVAASAAGAVAARCRCCCRCCCLCCHPCCPLVCTCCCCSCCCQCCWLAASAPEQCVRYYPPCPRLEESLRSRHLRRRRLQTKEICIFVHHNGSSEKIEGVVYPPGN